MQKQKGIIFDMDNTVIHSFIEYSLMHSKTCRMLKEAGIEPDESLSVSPIMQAAKNHPLMTEELQAAIWQMVREVEYEGLKKAVLEKGILDILEGVKPHANLFLITNNVHQDAEETVKHLGVRDYFDLVLGRGVTPALKPSPKGILYTLEQFPHLKASDLLATGDAVIDIQSASAAGVEKFIAYNSSHIENWQRIEQRPIHYLTKWDQEALEIFLRQLQVE
ncbi:MAG: HAD family hydrolase [Bacillota bacterium]|jgi:HAD superfamily hydrolase (TIGR01549 family)